MRVWLVDVVFASGPRIMGVTLSGLPDLHTEKTQAFTTEAEAVAFAMELVETARWQRNTHADEAMAYLAGRLRALTDEKAPA